MDIVNSSNDICPKTGGNEGEICAPNSQFIDGSCISSGVLKDMINAYNEEYKDDIIKIDMNLEILDPKKFKQQMVELLKEKLRKECGDDQTCWMTQSFIKKMDEIKRTKLKNYTFKPKGPEKQFEWLNQVQIDNVMTQYEVKNNDYIFLGSVPVDFYEINYNDIAQIDFIKDLINNGRTKIGMIINLDTHDKSGSHWVALYAHYDIPKSLVKIYFYDSYGIKPVKQIRSFMRKLARVAQELKLEYIDVAYSKKQNQEENSECGVYSMNFILRLLNGETFEDIEKRKVPDKIINQCRLIYFK